MILEKYYNKDLVNTFTSIILFIVSIVSANLLIRLFQKAYSQGLGVDAIIKFVILTLPGNVTIIAPIAFFLAVIICMGKFFSNNEMFVTLAGGVTWMEIAKMILKPAILLTIISFFTVMYLMPLSKQTSDIYQTSLSARALLSSITDNKIINAPNGRVFYIHNKSGNKLKKVFLYQNSAKDPDYKVITAPTATVESDKNAAFINFKNVNIYTKDLKDNKSNYGTADRAIYTIYDNSIRDYNHARLDRMYLGELIKNSWEGKLGSAAELSSRINNCIIVIVSTLLAIAMCRLRPRQNRYAKLLPSVIVLSIYLCANMLVNTMMANGQLSAWLGICLPHIFFITVSIYVIRKQNGSSKKG